MFSKIKALHARCTVDENENTTETRKRAKEIENVTSKEHFGKKRLKDKYVTYYIEII